MRLVQFISSQGERGVELVDPSGRTLLPLQGTASVYTLVIEADRLGTSLGDLVSTRVGMEAVDYDCVVREHRVLPPLDHPDPAHCYVTGTGLNYLGSALARNAYDWKCIDDLARAIKHKAPDPGKGRHRILRRATLEEILGKRLEG